MFKELTGWWLSGRSGIVCITILSNRGWYTKTIGFFELVDGIRMKEKRKKTSQWMSKSPGDPVERPLLTNWSSYYYLLQGPQDKQ
jgi:hypothetical protein